MIYLHEITLNRISLYFSILKLVIPLLRSSEWVKCFRMSRCRASFRSKVIFS